MCMAMLSEMFLRSVLVLSGVFVGETLPSYDQGNQGDWTLAKVVSDEFVGGTLDLRKRNDLGEDGDYRSEWDGGVPSQSNPKNIFFTNGPPGKLAFADHFELVESNPLKK